MRVQFKGTELVDAEVNIVSMVKNGANRLPFKIVKSEDSEMLDLTKLSNAFFKSAAPVANQVVAVMLAKSADHTAILKLLGEQGIDVASLVTKTEDDNAVTVVKADAEAALKDPSTAVVKFSDDIFMAITGIKKGFEGYDFESTSFKEIMSKGAFVPSICVAQDMFSRTMYNVLEKAATPKEAALQINQVTKDFSEYVTMLAKGLPDSAFKADMEITKAAQKKNPQAIAEDMKDGGKDDDKEDAYGKTKTKKDNGDGSAFEQGRQTQGGDNNTNDDEELAIASSKKTPNPTVPGLFRKEGESDAEYGARLIKYMDDQAKVEAKKAETAPMTDALAALTKAFNEGMQSLTKHVDDSVKSVRDEVQAVKTDVTKSLDGIVGGEANGDRSAVEKSEDDGERAPPLLDTGIMKLDLSKAKPLSNGRVH